VSRGWGAVQNAIVERCWQRVDQDDNPDSWWVSLDEMAGKERTARRESCRRAIGRLVAEGELESQVIEDMSRFLTDDRRWYRYRFGTLVCRIPPALVTQRAPPTLSVGL